MIRVPRARLTDFANAGDTAADGWTIGDMARKPVAVALFLLGAPLSAQTTPQPSDARISTELSVRGAAGGSKDAILVDVYVENREQSDLRKNQFSPISSSVGTPFFRFAELPGRDEISISPGLFTEAPDRWDEWYQPASGRDASQVGAFILKPGVRVHLLHGDLRRMVQEAGEYCQERLTNDRLLSRPEEAATRSHYEAVARFARRFAAAGTFDVTAWAYAWSNTVRIQTALPSR